MREARSTRTASRTCSGAHIGLGYLVVLSFLVLLILAAIARVGRPRLVWSALLFGLGILQVLLAWFGFEVPAIGALHPINALLIAGLAGPHRVRELPRRSRPSSRTAPAV